MMVKPSSIMCPCLRLTMPFVEMCGDKYVDDEYQQWLDIVQIHGEVPLHYSFEQPWT